MAISDPKRKDIYKYLKYSGIGFTLFGILIIAVYTGQYLDNWMNLNKPWWTIGLLILGFTGWMTKLVNDLEHDKRSD